MEDQEAPVEDRKEDQEAPMEEQEKGDVPLENQKYHNEDGEVPGPSYDPQYYPYNNEEVLSRNQEVPLEDWEDPLEDPLEIPQPSAPELETDNSYFSWVMDTFTSFYAKPDLN